MDFPERNLIAKRVGLAIMDFGMPNSLWFLLQDGEWLTMHNIVQPFKSILDWISDSFLG